MDAAAELDAWLKLHVAEPRRTLARGAASNLSDYAACEAEDLEDCLQISAWPPLARSRFLRAWRKLKGDEAPAPATAVATVATQTDIVGAVVPVAAAAVPTGSSSAAVAAADDDDFEASSDDDDDDGGARAGSKRRRGPRSSPRGPRTSSSRFRGVHRAKNKWAAKYTDRLGGSQHVGVYDDEEVAALKYNEAIIAAKLTDIRATNPVVDGRPQPTKQMPRDKSAARPPDPQRVKTTGSTSQYYGPCWQESKRSWQAKLRDASEKSIWCGTYNDEETAAREYHAAVHRFGLQAIRRTSVDASGALVPKPTNGDSWNGPFGGGAPLTQPAPPKAKSPAPPAPVPPPRVVVTRKPMPAARPPAPPPKQKFVVRVPPPKASPAAAPQPKPAPPPRPRTPPLEAFRKHAGPDGDRKAAVAAFFAAQRSDEAPPPKKARMDDAIGDGEVLSEMF